MDNDRVDLWRLQVIGGFCASVVIGLLIWGDLSLNRMIFGALFYVIGQVLFPKGLMQIGRPRRLRQLLFVA
ncbi:MAG: hypothetical protein ABI187_09955 [Ornithinibacter sp.]